MKRFAVITNRNVPVYHCVDVTDLSVTDLFFFVFVTDRFPSHIYYNK